VEGWSFSRRLCSSRLSRQKLAWPVSQTGLTGFALWAVEKGFWARKSLLRHGFICLDVEKLLRCFGSLGSFWTKLVWLVCQTGLTGFPYLREAKSNRSGLTSFRHRPDRFGLPAVVSCVFPLRVCCGCWLGLAPRFSSTSVAAWTWQEKLAEVHEWNRVHRPNSWIEFFISSHSLHPLLFAVSVLHALVRKSFFHIHCSPRNDMYFFVSLFGMLWLDWLSSW
jgi:hypothetical protein